MKKFLFLTLLFTAFSVSGQSFEPILTKEDNASWVAALKDENLTKQLEMIKTRWEEDLKIYYRISADAHGAKNVIEEEKRKGYINETRFRPLYLISTKEGDRIIFPANPSTEKLAAITEFLSPKNVTNIKVASKSTQLIYGHSGKNGVIQIRLAKKEIFDSITSQLGK